MTAPGTAREDHQAMEFSVTKSVLLNELNTTQGVVERKTTIPILSNLLVEAKGTRLTITATDLELSIRTSCEVKIKKEGAGTIPAKKLLELVRLLPEGEIKFRLLENHWVEIISEKKKYKLVGMARENFPAQIHSRFDFGFFRWMVEWLRTVEYRSSGAKSGNPPRRVGRLRFAAWQNPHTQIRRMGHP